MTVTAPKPAAMYDAYREVCAEAAAQKPSAWTFKRDPRYTPILEHVSYGQGIGYIDAIGEEFPQLWHDCIPILRRLAPLNDDLGKAWRVWFPPLNIECSPTNLRYLYHALKIRAHMEKVCFARNVDIIEVGGGYGGLALYLRALNVQMATAGIRSHTIFDLPEAGALQRAYTKAIGITVATRAPEDVPPPADAFAVSCYAYSEFEPAMREWYADRLLKHCPHGFMVWNGEAAGGAPVYPFVDTPLTIEDERPLTGPGNKVVTW